MTSNEALSTPRSRADVEFAAEQIGGTVGVDKAFARKKRLSHRNVRRGGRRSQQRDVRKSAARIGFVPVLRIPLNDISGNRCSAEF